MYYILLLPALYLATLSKPNSTIVLKESKDTVYIYTNVKKHMCDWKQDCPFNGNMYNFHSESSRAKFDQDEDFEYDRIHWDHPELTYPQIQDSLKTIFTNKVNL